MEENVLELKKSFWGHKYNYIYLIYRLDEDRFLYIGQTAQSTGVIGRLHQHLQGGTLIQRAGKRGIDIFSEDITLEYFLLTEKVFASLSYRESLETVIHNFIPQISSIEIISNIKYNNCAYIEHIAVTDLFEKMKSRLEKIFRRCEAA